MSDPAVNCRFRVEVDVDDNGQTDLGAFTDCEGLSAEFKMKEYVEGGQNAFVHHLAGPLSYPDIKLSRPVDESSATVAAWFSRMANAPERTTARITALGPAGEELATWTLVDVFPVKWTGPSFNVKGQDPAKESLVLNHNGFTTDVAASGASASASLSVSFGG